MSLFFFKLIIISSSILLHVIKIWTHFETTRSIVPESKYVFYFQLVSVNVLLMRKIQIRDNIVTTTMTNPSMEQKSRLTVRSWRKD